MMVAMHTQFVERVQILQVTKGADISFEVMQLKFLHMSPKGCYTCTGCQRGAGLVGRVCEARVAPEKASLLLSGVAQLPAVG